MNKKRIIFVIVIFIIICSCFIYILWKNESQTKKETNNISHTPTGTPVQTTKVDENFLTDYLSPFLKNLQTDKQSTSTMRDEEIFYHIVRMLLTSDEKEKYGVIQDDSGFLSIPNNTVVDFAKKYFGKEDFSYQTDDVFSYNPEEELYVKTLPMGFGTSVAVPDFEVTTIQEDGNYLIAMVNATYSAEVKEMYEMKDFIYELRLSCKKDDCMVVSWKSRG